MQFILQRPEAKRSDTNDFIYFLQFKFAHLQEKCSVNSYLLHAFLKLTALQVGPGPFSCQPFLEMQINICICRLKHVQTLVCFVAEP